MGERGAGSPNGYGSTRGELAEMQRASTCGQSRRAARETQFGEVDSPVGRAIATYTSIRPSVGSANGTYDTIR